MSLTLTELFKLITLISFAKTTRNHERIDTIHITCKTIYYV